MRVEVYYDEKLDALRIERDTGYWDAVIPLAQSRTKIAKELLRVVLRLLRIQGVA